MELFNFMPPHLREQAQDAVKGQKAVKFPSAYFRKAPQAMHVAWQNVCTLDQEGFVVKTAPDFLIDKLLQYLEKLEQPYEVIQL